jgi:hypothetical protein
LEKCFQAYLKVCRGAGKGEGPEVGRGEELPKKLNCELFFIYGSNYFSHKYKNFP